MTTSNDAVKEVVPRIGYILGPVWLIIVFLAYSYSYYTFDVVQWEIIEVLGFILTISSSIIRLWCYQTLGRLFTFDLAIRTRHKLITVGPYRYIRHPSYTALILSTLGYSLYIFKVFSVYRDMIGLSNFWYVLALISPTCFVIFFVLKRIPKEEEMLRLEFKEKWRKYVNQTWILIPFY
jgi:protein-S-isoprenylcysteine O-methyltransferase Ste14